MKKIFLLLFFVLGLVVVSCAHAPTVDWTLSISGKVAEPLSFSYKELAEMPQIQLEDVFMDKSIGEDQIGAWSGVPLISLLEASNADPDFVTVTALASDGYAIEITKEELEGSLVALKVNGEWIQKADPEHGPLRLVCPKTPADRWVYKIVELQVNS